MVNTVIALILAGFLTIPGIRADYVTITDCDNGIVKVNDSGDSFWREDNRFFEKYETAIGVFNDMGTPEKEDDMFIGVFHLWEILQEA